MRHSQRRDSDPSVWCVLIFAFLLVVVLVAIFHPPWYVILAIFVVIMVALFLLALLRRVSSRQQDQHRRQQHDHAEKLMHMASDKFIQDAQQVCDTMQTMLRNRESPQSIFPVRDSLQRLQRESDQILTEVDNFGLVHQSSDIRRMKEQIISLIRAAERQPQEDERNRVEGRLRAALASKNKVELRNAVEDCQYKMKARQIQEPPSFRHAFNVANTQGGCTPCGPPCQPPRDDMQATPYQDTHVMRDDYHTRDQYQDQYQTTRY